MGTGERTRIRERKSIEKYQLSKLSILSKIGIMKSVSATEAKQRLAALLDAAQREPVLIRRQNRDVAVIISAKSTNGFAKLTSLNSVE